MKKGFFGNDLKNGLVLDDCDTEYWYVDDILHRDDGPAIVQKDGFQAWFMHGQCHRIDGPAITRADGTVWWWLYDSPVSSPFQFQRASGCTDEELAMLILKYGNIR